MTNRTSRILDLQRRPRTGVHPPISLRRSRNPRRVRARTAGTHADIISKIGGWFLRVLWCVLRSCFGFLIESCVHLMVDLGFQML